MNWPDNYYRNPGKMIVAWSKVEVSRDGVKERKSDFTQEAHHDPQDIGVYYVRHIQQHPILSFPNTR